MGDLTIELRIRREQLLDAVKDPLGYGHQGRIAIDRDAESQIDFYDSLVAFYSLRNKPVPTEARAAFLLTHGFYTAAELNMDAEFSKTYHEKVMSEETKAFIEGDFQKEVVEAVISALEQKEEFFKGDKEAVGLLDDLWKTWQAKKDTMSLQEKSNMLCMMQAFLQDNL